MESKPSLLAWITCDGVHIDPASGKHTILGVFSNIKAMAFPVTHPYMVWFLTLTDVQPGTHRIKMSMGLDPTNPTELLNREFESKSPLHRINLINELRNLRFDKSGDYSNRTTANCTGSDQGNPGRIVIIHHSMVIGHFEPGQIRVGQILI